MTEREKIIKIIAPYVAAYGEDEAIANALIAAGLKFDVDYSFTATFDHIQQARIDYLECRAAVAERQAVILSKWLGEKTRKNYPWQAWFDAAQKQAEKELAEEKTNKH